MLHGRPKAKCVVAALGIPAGSSVSIYFGAQVNNLADFGCCGVWLRRMNYTETLLRNSGRDRY